MTIEFIPLSLATLTLALTLASFMKYKNKQNWLIIAFVIWLMAFVGTLVRLGVFNIR